MLGLYWGYFVIILGLYWVYIGVILGFVQVLSWKRSSYPTSSPPATKAALILFFWTDPLFQTTITIKSRAFLRPGRREAGWHSFFRSWGLRGGSCVWLPRGIYSRTSRMLLRTAYYPTYTPTSPQVISRGSASGAACQCSFQVLFPKPPN